MKFLKRSFLIFVLFCLSIFLSGCSASVQNSSQNQEQIQQLENTYFNYPFRDHPIGKPDSNPLYWECSDQNINDNYFCSSYNGKFHSGEDWNLKGGSSGEIDEGRPVYSIGEGKVIYAKEEKDASGSKIGLRVVVEHIGTCIIPAKENIEGSRVSYKQEVVGKIYSVYLHLKDVQVKVGDEIKDEKINKPIGYITKAGTGSHLHFEIRKEWNNVYDSYFDNIQKIIDLGFRDPSEFIEANMLESKVAKGSSQTIPEESVSIETESLDVKGEEVGDETNKIDNYNKKLTEYLIYRSEVEKLDIKFEKTYIDFWGYIASNINNLDDSNYNQKIEFLKSNSNIIDNFIMDYYKIKTPIFAKDASNYCLEYLENAKQICDNLVTFIEKLYLEENKIKFNNITSIEELLNSEEVKQLFDEGKLIDELYKNISILQNKRIEEFNKIEQGFDEEAELLGLTQPFTEK